MIDESEVIVRLMDFPTRTRGFILHSPDGAYNVYLNARQSRNIQRETLEHELRHIKNDDLESDKPVWEIEAAMRRAK